MATLRGHERLMVGGAERRDGRAGISVHVRKYRATGRVRRATIGAMPDRPLKVLIAKPGLDGHDRGAKVLARGLRDEGFEVVYTGLRQTPEMIATAALQEDVDVVGLSILSGAHMTLVPRVTKLLTDRGMGDVLVTVGGIIPDDDVAALKAAGVAEVFGPGTTIAQVAGYLRSNARPRE
jgi:methylmalonyl-CoA mutase, C-terminal domain